MKAILILTFLQFISINAKVAFEKLTDFDFVGTTYYSVKNLSLYECQGWCNQEAECQAAAFSFVVNPLLPEQETLCQLHNETQAMNPAALPQRSNSMYYMVKLNIRSENICARPWTFERVPNKIIRGLDNALIYTSTKEACLSACLNEVSSSRYINQRSFQILSSQTEKLHLPIGRVRLQQHEVCAERRR